MKNFRQKYFGDAAFYKMVFVIAVPIMIQNGITNFVNMLDNIMIGQIGTEAMSGVSIVNQILFVYNLCLFGAVSGAHLYGAVLRAEKYRRYPPYCPLQTVGRDLHYDPHCFVVHFLRSVFNQHLSDRRRQCCQHSDDNGKRQGVYAVYVGRSSFLYDNPGLWQHFKRMRPDDPAHESRRRRYLY